MCKLTCSRAERCMCVRMRVHVCANVCANVCIRELMCVYVCMVVYVFIYVHASMCVFGGGSVCAHTLVALAFRAHLQESYKNCKATHFGRTYRDADEYAQFEVCMRAGARAHACTRLWPSPFRRACCDADEHAPLKVLSGTVADNLGARQVGCALKHLDGGCVQGALRSTQEGEALGIGGGGSVAQMHMTYTHSCTCMLQHICTRTHMYAHTAHTSITVVHLCPHIHARPPRAVCLLWGLGCVHVSPLLTLLGPAQGSRTSTCCSRSRACIRRASHRVCGPRPTQGITQFQWYTMPRHCSTFFPPLCPLLRGFPPLCSSGTPPPLSPGPACWG